MDSYFNKKCVVDTDRFSSDPDPTFTDMKNFRFTVHNMTAATFSLAFRRQLIGTSSATMTFSIKFLQVYGKQKDAGAEDRAANRNYGSGPEGNLIPALRLWCWF